MTRLLQKAKPSVSGAGKPAAKPALPLEHSVGLPPGLASGLRGPCPAPVRGISSPRRLW